MKKSPFLKNFSNTFKFFSLIVIIIISTFLITLLGVGIAIHIWGIDVLEVITGKTQISLADNINIYKYLQIFNHLGMFLIPSLLFAFFVRGNIGRYLKINHFPGLFTAVSAVLLIFISLPFINWLITVNEMMELPSYLAGIEEWMRNTEDSAKVFTEAFLNVTTINGFLLNIFMIAIIPAVGEEFLFRGVLQKHFKEWFGNVHIAIILSAFLFSAMHLQFYGFIPRFALGLLLGYLYFFSRNLWIPVIAHLINNGFAVLIYFLNIKKITHTDIDKIGSAGDDYSLIIGSLIFSVIILMSIYQRERIRKRISIKKED